MSRDLSRFLPDVEDAFGFVIPQEDAARLSTIGELYDYILAHRCREECDTRLVSMAFYKIRRALMSLLPLSRDAVQPCTKLSAILPRRRRRIRRAIERQTGLRLPLLRRSTRIVKMSTLAAVGLGVTGPLLVGLTPLRGATFAAIVLTAVLGYAFYGLTQFLAYEFPPGLVTMGDLAKATFARNYQAIVGEAKTSPTDAEVWNTLRRIVGEPSPVPLGVVAVEMDQSPHFIVN